MGTGCCTRFGIQTAEENGKVECPACAPTWGRNLEPTTQRQVYALMLQMAAITISLSQKHTTYMIYRFTQTHTQPSYMFWGGKHSRVKTE